MRQVLEAGSVEKYIEMRNSEPKNELNQITQLKGDNQNNTNLIAKNNTSSTISSAPKFQNRLSCHDNIKILNMLHHSYQWLETNPDQF